DAAHSAAERTDGSAGQESGSGRGGYGGAQGAGGTGTGGGGGGTLARPDYGVNPKPPYPLIARRMGAQGVVVLRVLVQANGTVGEVTVSQSSGFSVLDESALKTVRERWRFVPARLDGRPVASWVEVPIRFVLAGS
ncbi:MAG: energy transducer TonB, partial [Thermodesulfobacteriota bacterium]